MAFLPDITPSTLHEDDPQRQIQAIVKQLNDWGRRLSNEDRTKITKDDSGVQRLLQGYQQGGFSNGDVGIKLSQVGKDVAGATDDELIWSSDFDSFKIITSGTVILNRPAATATVSTVITAPTGANAFLAWATVTNASPLLTYALTYYAPNGTGGISWGVRAYYDATAGAVKFFHESYDSTTTASEYDVTIKYYLLRETLT